MKFYQMLVTVAAVKLCDSLIFRVDQFNDVSDVCRTNDGKLLTYIVDDDTPARYISIDPGFRIKTINKIRRADQQSKLFNIDQDRLLKDLAADLRKQSWPPGTVGNETFNCILHIQTALPKGDKSTSRYDALSMIIIEMDFSRPHPSPLAEEVEIETFGHEGDEWKKLGAQVSLCLPGNNYSPVGREKLKVTKPAHYSDRMWAATNPNFLIRAARLHDISTN